MATVRDKKLVIVESPAKAKTISQFLGVGYLVEASFGHVRDLPQKAAEIPPDVKKEKWSRIGVNVENGYEPLYIVPNDKKKHVARLRAALKEADSILLATDEDREGESISWHLLQVLRPPKRVNVQRIVFHEITREAIMAAITNPRAVNDSLVRAQESRRILDRLYGYTLSPLLWKKVAPRLSAGRVQSVATRLCVLRERERRAFIAAHYWDLLADVQAMEGSFRATLVRIDGRRLATGRSFEDTTGKLIEDRALLDEAAAHSLEKAALAHRPWLVSRLVQKPGSQRPVPPFTTSTLQQEANRKLRFSSKRTMQIAQGLYEGIDLGGERVGLITYMRTDSLSLSERAITEARQVISQLFGAEYLPPSPIRYKTRSKGAQEAHEAIRPSDLSRRPQDLRSFLNSDQFRLYEMIWKRTIACQMVPARIMRTSVEITVDNLLFSASGRQILFPGFLRAYVEGSDDPEAQLGDRETLLPALQEGQTLTPTSVTAQGHSTKAPARFTEASLVKKLEEEGIGRPSTYAAIISTIQDRGYILKRGTELIPTFTALCVTEFLETHFKDLVDTSFTSIMEEQLDEIASGKRDSLTYLKDFYQGSSTSRGLIQRVEDEQANLDFPRVPVGEDPNTSEPIIVKMGRFGPYLQRGEGGDGNFAPVPDELPPAELSLDKALEIFQERAKGPQVVAENSTTGLKATLQKGRFGEYLELVDPDLEEGAKPKRVSLPRGLSVDDVTPEIAWQLLSLPRTVGNHPENGESITTAIGRFGPFVKCGKEFRSLENWQAACNVSLEEAVVILKQPKKGRGRSASPAKVLRDLGALEGAGGPVKILDGRYGPYVTDGTVNASLPKGRAPEDITEAEALELLAQRAAKVGTRKRRGTAKTRKTAPKKATAGKSTPKKSTPKKATAGKTAPKKATAGKTAPKKATAGKTPTTKKASGAQEAEASEKPKQPAKTRLRRAKGSDVPTEDSVA